MGASEEGKQAFKAQSFKRNAGVEQEFERLFRENWGRVYGYAYSRLVDRYAAEDCASEAFLSAARNFSRFDPTRASFSTWIMAIVRNRIVDYTRKRRPDIVDDDVLANNDRLAEEDAYPSLDGNVDREAEVAKLLGVLSDDERELVFMKYFEEKRNTEIAHELGMNESTVSSRLYRAMAKMRRAAAKPSAAKSTR